MKICKTFNIYKIYKIWSPVLPPNSSFAGAGILLRPRPFKTFFESAENYLSEQHMTTFFMYLSHIFTKGRPLPSKQLHVQGQQYKSQNIWVMCIKFKIKTPEQEQLIPFWCLYVNFEHALCRFVANSNITCENS